MQINKVCSICQEVVSSEGNDVLRKSCWHAFHGRCVEGLRSDPRITDCFNCRAQTDPNSPPSLRERLIWAYSKGYDYGFSHSPNITRYAIGVAGVTGACISGGLAISYALMDPSSFGATAAYLLSHGAVVLATTDLFSLKSHFWAAHVGLLSVAATLIGGASTGIAVTAGAACASAYEALAELTFPRFHESRWALLGQLTGSVISAGLAVGMDAGWPAGCVGGIAAGIGWVIPDTPYSVCYNIFLDCTFWQIFNLRTADFFVGSGENRNAATVATVAGSLSGVFSGLAVGLRYKPEHDVREANRVLGKRTAMRQVMGGICGAGALTAQCLREVGRGAKVVGQRLAEMREEAPLLTRVAGVGVAALVTGALLYAGL